MSEIKTVTSCVIDRTKWLRGEGNSKSALLRESDGKMCCLGQIALEAGFTEDEIRNKIEPCSIGWTQFTTKNLNNTADIIAFSNKKHTLDMMSINDAALIKDEFREKRLIELAKEINIDLSFKN